MTTSTAPLAITARDFLAAARANIARVIEFNANDGREWNDYDVYQRYTAVVRSLSVWIKDEHTIVASVADTRDGRIWGYVAADVLDGIETTDEILYGSMIGDYSETVRYLKF